jgi:hypothetical protein
MVSTNSNTEVLSFSSSTCTNEKMYGENFKRSSRKLQMQTKEVQMNNVLRLFSKYVTPASVSESVLEKSSQENKMCYINKEIKLEIVLTRQMGTRKT